MTEDNKKKMGFFKRIITSIKDFEQYQTFALENLGVAVKYLLKLMLIFTVVICLSFLYKFGTIVNNGVQYFKENIQEVIYQEGKLSVNQNEPIVIEDENSMLQAIIVATGEVEEQSYLDILNKYPNGIIFFQDRMVFKNEMVTTNAEYRYTDIATTYQIGNFTKQDMVKGIESINVVAFYSAVFLTIFLYMFMIYLSSTIIDVLVLAVLGFIVARITGMRIKFKASFNMGVYALTLPILLNLIYIVVNTFTGFTIQYFQWMYTTISYIYMIVALLMIKTDLINRQKEVAKIQQEQEKVREELEQQKEQEKKEKEKQEENKETKKEEDKEEPILEPKKEKDNQTGEEPEGQKA